MARRLGDVVGGDPRQRLLRIAADEHELSEGGLVEYCNALAGCLVLTADGIEPVLALVAVDVLGLLPARRIGKPVRPFPTELLAKAGTFRLEPVVEGRAAQRPSGAILLERPGHGVMFGVGLERAGAHPACVEMVPAKAANIDRP